ncbi:hypothetical protein LCGC14_1887550 [marine sediment metagenome]|uniref:Uncharacterized protein n=1 Tax=marine sediment metagenome TaxID=412755 RepID=A0A0F9IEA9_9ZZZZ
MLEEKITEVVDKLMLLSEQLAAPAFQTVLNAVQIESIWFLAVGTGLALSLPLLYKATKGMIRASQATEARDSDDITIIAQVGLAIVLGASVPATATTFISCIATSITGIALALTIER